MSSMLNHKKRSHRSQRMHYQAAGITRRQVAANSFHQRPVAANSFHQRPVWKDVMKGLFRRGGREPIKTVMGEIVDV